MVVAIAPGRDAAVDAAVQLRDHTDWLESAATFSRTSQQQQHPPWRVKYSSEPATSTSMASRR